jgi:hypothetical protein
MRSLAMVPMLLVLAGCQPSPPPPSAALRIDQAQTVLINLGYSNPVLEPSFSYAGGWTGTAMRDGRTIMVTIDKDGHIVE